MDEQSESTIGSSPVTVFLTTNCSVMGTEIPMRQMEKQQKAFRFNKIKFFGKTLSSFFCFNFVFKWGEECCSH